MCHYCSHHAAHMPLVFAWPEDACEKSRRYVLADLLSVLKDTIGGAENERTLTPAAGDGIASLLGMIEQALRFDVPRIGPQREGAQHVP